MKFRAAVLALSMMASAGGAQADNLEKLSQFKSTGSSLDIESVEQDAKTIASIRKVLERITLPDGFKIDLYALVPNARDIAVGPQGSVVFVSTGDNDIWAIGDRDKDRIGESVLRFAPTVDFTIPHGLCFSRDGFMYVVEQNRVLVIAAAEYFFGKADVAAFKVVDQGALIPPDEESYNHTTRVCAIGPDNRLYISLGQPFNVFPREKLALYEKTGIGGIISMERDGSDRQVFAKGVRNSVGLDFNPANGELWFTDNQVDGMGDDIPPGELNRATKAGQHFGFPWYGGGVVRTNEYKEDTLPENLVEPEVEMIAHAADLGMTFYQGRMFPEKYKGGIFSAQHGSWNRTEPVGARVMFTPLKEDGSAGETQVFAEGWLDENGEYFGRPVDVAVLRDGSILVSDDYTGAVYRISYGQ